MKFKLKQFPLILAASGLLALAAARQASAVTLGTASSFAVLGASTVTNTGPSVVHGDLGVSPGTAVTGFPPGNVVNGSIHSADAAAGLAQSDAMAAYTALKGMASPPANDLTGQDLGGLTLVPGVYHFSSSAFLTGALTLDAKGDANALFVFQMGSTLVTASNSEVLVINGGSGCNVYWQVGSSATLGTGTNFVGRILALASITLTTNASVEGSAMALTAAVTMDSNDVALCAAGGGNGGGHDENDGCGRDEHGRKKHSGHKGGKWGKHGNQGWGGNEGRKDKDRN